MILNKLPKQCILDEKKIDDDLRTTYATSREDECFEARVVFETSGDEGARMRKACVIEGDKKCKADKIEEIAMKKDIESEVLMDESMTDGYVETFPTLVLDTWELTDVRPKRRKVVARKQREKLMPTTLKWKWQRLS